MNRNTVIKLYEGVNLTIGSNDTFYFEDVGAQNRYFASKVRHVINNSIYTRNNRTYIRVPFPISTVYKINYCSYVNTDYENKITYCFVTDIVYINDNVTELEIVEDIHQTWFFNYGIDPCFVERMHTFSDNIGDNLVADSFDLGDFKSGSWRNGLGGADDIMCIVAECSFGAFDWSNASAATWTNKSTPHITNRNGLFSATELVAFPIRTKRDGSYNYAGSGCAFAQFMGHVNRGDGGVTVNDILSMWVYPFQLLQNLNSKVLSTSAESPFDKIYQIGQILQNVVYEYGSRPLHLDNYYPKNKKLLTYPFVQLMASNNNGSITTYKYEYFNNPNNIQFRVLGTTTSEAKVRIIPLDYKGIDIDFTEGLDSAPFPIVSYVGDAYNIWYSQNRNTIENAWNALELQATVGIAASAIGATANIGQQAGITGTYYDAASKSTSVVMNNNVSGGALAMQGANVVGNMANTALNTVMQAKSMLSKQQDAMLAPNTAKGVQSQGIAYQSDKTFTVYAKTIDAQHAKRIDDYFTMFGYPINEITYPQRKNRRGFTYVKTLDCHVNSSTMPESKRRAIENAFNNGVRFWADVDHIGDYTIDNTV